MKEASEGLDTGNVTPNADLSPIVRATNSLSGAFTQTVGLTKDTQYKLGQNVESVRSTIDAEVGMLTRGLNPFIEVKKINPDGAEETMNVEDAGLTPSLMHSRFQITSLAFQKHNDGGETLKKLDRETPGSSTKDMQKYETQR